MFSLDGERPLVEVPLIPRPRTAATELIRILLAKLPTPFPNRFIGHDHTTFTQELFDITEAQAEAKVQPDSVAMTSTGNR
jgi:hypothetical protein